MLIHLIGEVLYSRFEIDGGALLHAVIHCAIRYSDMLSCAIENSSKDYSAGCNVEILD